MAMSDSASGSPNGLDWLSINTIRTLSMDAVQKADSGHPGTPMALAPLAYVLWQEFMNYDPADPAWPGRDRFVLSAGHASMLLYSVLHLGDVQEKSKDGRLTGNPAVSLKDIEDFRQMGSRCPGHPEYGITSGVETTTGPLGQGSGNSVGMAIASRWLAQRYGALYDYATYAIASDGCMMEGVASEAASLAGHLGLSNLCWMYDRNRITIEGSTELAFSEDVGARFKAYGWNVLTVSDVNDLGQVRSALQAFQAFRAAGKGPTLIVVDSHIGFGSPHKQDKASAHGEALGEDEVRLSKRAYGWPEDAHFLVPAEVLRHFAEGFGARGMKARLAWNRKLEEWKKNDPAKALEVEQLSSLKLPDGWDRDLPSFPPDEKGLAGREASSKAQNAIARHIPWLLGGSADLAPSTKTLILGDVSGGDFSRSNPGGRNLHFGIREHAMGSILNGLALSHLRPYGSTFLIFSDYERPAIRLAALMEVPVIQIFTHDSIGLGEDGPTHQPIEQLASLRAIPGLLVIRPSDANEVVEAWRVIAQLRDQPVALVLTRQAMPTLDRATLGQASGLARGAYVLSDPKSGKPEVAVLATGSEVALALRAARKLESRGARVRVVAMPCWELFERQDAAYRESVLPSSLKARVSVEQAGTFGWDQYTGLTGERIGMTGFGASAPIKDLLKKFGFTEEKIIEAALRQIEISR